MTTRLSYEDSIRQLQQVGYLADDESPPMPNQRPQWDDESLGFGFFRTTASDDDFSGLTLPRTYFQKSELTDISFINTDLSESTMCWNDFLAVDFSGASLVNCDLRASVFKDCEFDDADLSGSDLRGSSFHGCTFHGASMDHVILTPSQGRKLGPSIWFIRLLEWLSSPTHPLVNALSDEQLTAVDWQEDDEGPSDG